MKPVQNPTTYFFKQAENPPNIYEKEIEEFVSKLINKSTCLLCKQDYTITDRLPRILIHCGHTFCTVCLKNFYNNERVRCPMCLKLVKHLTMIQMLPINHTIFEDLVKKNNILCQKQGKQSKIKDAGQFLFSQFQRIQKQVQIQQNPPQIDQNSGLPFCALHRDRVQHFFCVVHKTAGCRVCVQVGHSKISCKVIDLYQIQSPQALINMMGNQSNQQNVPNSHFSNNDDNDLLDEDFNFHDDDDLDI